MIRENIERIRNDIPENVVLVAAVKYADSEQIKEIVEAGVKDLGFNTFQQMRDVSPFDEDVKLHFIGHLQKNKVRKVLEFGIYLIQGVDSYELCENINRICGDLGIKQKILLQVRTDKDKEFGIDPFDLEEIILKIKNNLYNIEICGLMTIPPLVGDVKIYFSLMKEYYDKFSERFDKFDYLSMGMSNDYKTAIEEGANMVRIGRAIFD
jgi:pyridoxal phosphate enzyme (YggS family)